MENLIDGELAKTLEAGRPRFNALFAQARRATPTLDPAAFADHLRKSVAPVAAAVSRVAPERLSDVVDVLYEFSLDLVGKDFAVRYPAVLQGWGSLLGGLPRHLAAAPRLFAGAVTNALYNLSVTPGARPLEWLERMRSLGSQCDDVAALLDAGKICAWQAGMAHFRDAALSACEQLVPPLVRAALGSAETLDPAALKRLREDPWLAAATATRGDGQKKLGIMATVGGFRGFGGPFLAPPTVGCADGHIFAEDGQACWQLCADRYGATLHRVGARLPKASGKSPFQVAANGTVKAAGLSERFEELQGASSSAGTAHTFAVTVPLSHRIYLVALTQETT